MTDKTIVNDEAPKMSRRQLLVRLGLGAAAAYTAPVLLQLNPASASGFSGGSFSGLRTRRQGTVVRRPRRRSVSFSR
jgi:hypothetical protein